MKTKSNNETKKYCEHLILNDLFLLTRIIKTFWGILIQLLLWVVFDRKLFDTKLCVFGRLVCNLLANGAVALFGPLSGRTSLHIQSISDSLEIPHIECHWNIEDQVDHLSINLYPKPSSLSRAYVDLVKAWNWKSFAIIYEDNHGMD